MNDFNYVLGGDWLIFSVISAFEQKQPQEKPSSDKKTPESELCEDAPNLITG